MPISQADIKSILAEKDSERLDLICNDHQYVGDKMPPKQSGCQRCWMAYYCFDLATTPPSLRKERLDELEHVIHRVVDMVKKNKFDFIPEERPEIIYTKDGFDDDTNLYKEDK